MAECPDQERPSLDVLLRSSPQRTSSRSISVMKKEKWEGTRDTDTHMEDSHARGTITITMMMMMMTTVMSIMLTHIPILIHIIHMSTATPVSVLMSTQKRPKQD